MDRDAGYGFVGAEELYGLIRQGRGPALIDTLPEEHYTKAHLPGAENACVYQVVFGARMAELVPDKEREIVLYGSSEASRDAATAAGKLIRAGYRNVAVLSGGLTAWREKGYPLEGTDPSGPDEPARVVLPEGTYAVDSSLSLIEWAGRNPNVKHHGTLQLSGGFFAVKNGNVTGSFTIDMRSIRNINLEGDPWQPALLAHLGSDDFFFVDLFPTATFQIESAALENAASLSAPNFRVEGSLTLRDAMQPLTFMATLGTLPDGAFSAEAHFDIDRTKWDIIYGSSRFYEHLGMHLVFDLISVQVRIVAR